MKFKGQEIPREVVEKAMQCDTPEELVALAKEHGFEITTKQAEAYLAELEDFDLDSEQMKKVSGGMLLDKVLSYE
jgi:predicted ribosomally synthesized peptide with nif11-like leader